MAELETVDIQGVELLAAGGPVFGIGSPPEGDFWTEDDLRAMADAGRELADELKPPNKIGHSDGQQLLLNSGIGQPTDGEMPAVGWIDAATMRVEPAADGEPAKLLGDLKEVPKKFAELVKAKAYRTRSVELSKVTSQTTGKVYDWVVTGLAWLGAKLPAVRTLDDIVALYETDGVELRRVFAAGDIVWSPTDGYESLRFRVSEALNGETGGGMNMERFWVRDVAADRALIQDMYDDATPQSAWIVPFTVDAEGQVTVADRALWTEAQGAWLEVAKSYAERTARKNRTAADTRSEMAETTYTDEQRRSFSEATGVELDKVTDEMLATAGVPVEKSADERDLEADERVRALETTVREADERSRKLETELHTERRRNFVEGVLKEGKAKPGQRTELETLFDKDPELAHKIYAEAPVDQDLIREYGSGDESSDEERELEAEEYDVSFERVYGSKPMFPARAV